MNKIVRDHYPVERLPEEFRTGLSGRAVRLTIEPIPDGEEGEELPLTRILEDMQDHRVFHGDPVERIRALRAESDWRDEFLDRIRSGDAD